MIRLGIPLTRARYLQLDFGPNVPDPLDFDYIVTMPPEFRDDPAAEENPDSP